MLNLKFKIQIQNIRYLTLIQFIINSFFLLHKVKNVI